MLSSDVFATRPSTFSYILIAFSLRSSTIRGDCERADFGVDVSCGLKSAADFDDVDDFVVDVRQMPGYGGGGGRDDGGVDCGRRR